MKKLKDEELKKVNGGAANAGGAIYNTDNSIFNIVSDPTKEEVTGAASGGFVGGICGEAPQNISIEDCDNTAKITDGAGIGGGRRSQK